MSRHAISPLPSLAAGGTAVLLATLAHARGWAIPRGGSQAIVDALVADLVAHEGTIETGRRVRSRSDLPSADVVLLDVSADDALRILGRGASRRTARGLAALGHRGAAAKLDLVVRGPIPWRDAPVGLASTVHIGGTAEQMAVAERDVLAGRMPESPVVLLSDPAVADAGREVAGLRPVWAYAHVPLGCDVDPTEMILRQIERFAPGFRDTVVASRGIAASAMGEHDRAIVGGDIAMGTVSLPRMIARPRAAWDPFRLDERTFLSSAAAVPGPGVHGMAGYYAARRALSTVLGDARAPRLGPLS